MHTKEAKISLAFRSCDVHFDINFPILFEPSRPLHNTSQNTGKVLADL